MFIRNVSYLLSTDYQAFAATPFPFLAIIRQTLVLIPSLGQSLLGVPVVLLVYRVKGLKQMVTYSFKTAFI